MYPSSLLRVQGDLKKHTTNQQSLTPEAAIIKILRVVVGDTNLVSDFSQSWAVQEFQLGDEREHPSFLQRGRKSVRISR
ncbi:hypothetical protein VB735_31825, partial [Halotia wernerae UHCC 0503]|nr:hypothetical protein [Halotia wernerae UHCC 0503]